MGVRRACRFGEPAGIDAIGVAAAMPPVSRPWSIGKRRSSGQIGLWIDPDQDIGRNDDDNGFFIFQNVRN
jgi:hypothetical protein